MSDFTPYPELVKSKKSYQEDFTHENGNYFCLCLRCGSQFLGHKRRSICKECLTPSKRKKLWFFFGCISPMGIPLLYSILKIIKMIGGVE